MRIDYFAKTFDLSVTESWGEFCGLIVDMRLEFKYKIKNYFELLLTCFEKAEITLRNAM